ncbi:alpha/beta hydrolase [Streptomyces sp. BE133]|uniref:alpha/beta hydrolase n=1 Tax=Streptomyces sp. BE133 TaxID=3002523 RepID=UPI002E77D664|nr:alpha/beta hydrolase family protein [Streptomyces sp. BE133]MEE1809448.1 alpha/beta hydrolase [Streptomyces sp. BE133]
MSFTWPLDPQDLFVERYPQMTLGLPVDEVDAVRAAVTEMWPDRPGGWVYEWSTLAARHAEAGRHRLASQAYGWAKFPSLADDPKRTALARQVEQYALAAPGFPVEFERRTLTVPYRGGEATLPIHLIAAPGLPADAPVVLASGGVDSWKTDLHGMWEQLAFALPARLLLFDLAGTGETAHLPMTPDGGAEVIAGLVSFARAAGNGKVGHFGISMGGYYSARSGLTGAVDASVVLGGPVERSFAPGRGFAFGMDGIVGNALGFDAMPSTAEREEAFAAFDLRPLLDQDANGPMLVVNGTEDVHVPLDDTLVFEGRRDTRVELIPDTGHCAISRFGEAMAVIAPWLKDTLIG